MLKFGSGLVLSLVLLAFSSVAHADDVAAVQALANKGDAEAQAIMGARYAFGCGVEQSQEQSFKWYMKAAEQGEPWAQMELGDDYFLGYGVVKNDVKAAEWLLKADKTRPLIADGLYNLGGLYASGQGVPQSFVEAYYWFSRAALIPNDNIASDAVFDREEMAKKLTKSQKDDVEKRLKKFRHLALWKPKAGNAEDTAKWASCAVSGQPNRLQWNTYIIKVPSPSDTRTKK